MTTTCYRLTRLFIATHLFLLAQIRCSYNRPCATPRRRGKDYHTPQQRVNNYMPATTGSCQNGKATLKSRSASSNQAPSLRNSLRLMLPRLLNRRATSIFFEDSGLGSFVIHGISILDLTGRKDPVSPTHSLESPVRSTITSAPVKSTTSTARFTIVN